MFKTTGPSDVSDFDVQDDGGFVNIFSSIEVGVVTAVISPLYEPPTNLKSILAEDLSRSSTI